MKYCEFKKILPNTKLMRNPQWGDYGTMLTSGWKVLFSTNKTPNDNDTVINKK
jgi:hypothetical protein